MTAKEYINSVLPVMEGWCSKDKATKIAEIASQPNFKTYVEVGVFGGRSLIAAALSLSQDGIAIGIDPWSRKESVHGFTDANLDWWGKLDHDDIYDKCRKSIERFGLEKKVFLIRATSEQALPLIKRIGEVDAVYIDGNHHELTAMFDAVSYGGIVRAGGHILLDDMDWTRKADGKDYPTTKRAQEYLASICELVCQVENMGVYRKK